jgi:hypothetical protein
MNGASPSAASSQELLERASSRVGSAHPFVTRRGLIGFAFVVFVFLVRAGSNYLSGVEPPHVVGHLAFRCAEVPTVMVALEATYRALTRRGVGPRRTLLTLVALTALLGVASGLALLGTSLLTRAVLLHPVPAYTAVWASFYGITSTFFDLGMWALAFVFPAAIEDVRARGLEAERLKANAELAQLRSHLEPHFILNTLQAIAGLVTVDPREARRLIGAVGDLLRDALTDDVGLQTIEEQVAWMRTYAEIARARRPDGTRFHASVAQDARGVLIPRLLLQPLLERSFRRLEPAPPATSTVRLDVGWADPTRLRIVLEEEGAAGIDDLARGLPHDAVSAQRRLELRYPGSSLSLASDRVDGVARTHVVIEVPRREIEAALAEVPPRGVRVGAEPGLGRAGPRDAR